MSGSVSEEAHHEWGVEMRGRIFEFPNREQAEKAARGLRRHNARVVSREVHTWHFPDQQHPFGSVCPHGVQMLDECEECK